jgi:molybdenum cofactor cytidylyltransferase
MPPPDRPFACAVVLAAGGSRRLGRPKQLLPFGSGTLLDHTVRTARGCGLEQVVVALGARAAEVRSRVDLAGAAVVENPGFGAGCASSLAVALGAVDPRAEVVVLLLGDQPGVTPATVSALLAGRGDAEMAVCRYDDGRGHPLAFGRPMFAALGSLRGDKAVWRLIERLGDSVAEVRVPGPVPLDVDTWEDYEAVLAGTGSGAGRHDRPRAAAS